MNNIISNLGASSGASMWVSAVGPLLLLIVLWSILWKGLALWHAGRRGHVWMFIVMLVVNTLGILEIIYLFAFLKLKFSQLFSK